MSDAIIEIRRLAGDDPLEFQVTVREGRSETAHRVTLAPAQYRRLSGGRRPEQCIEAAFRFLLDREPKESILRQFDVSVIGRYFPEFEQELPDYLGR